MFERYQRMLTARGYWNEAGEDVAMAENSSNVATETASGENLSLFDTAPTNTDSSSETAETEPQQHETPTSWRDAVKDPELVKFASNFNTIEDALKSGLHFRQKLSNAVAIPGANASAEEIADFNKKLGVPESVDGYTVNKPDMSTMPETVTDEILSGVVEQFKEPLLKAGATPQVADAVFKTAMDIVAQSHQNALQAAEESLKVGEAQLRNEWGSDFETNQRYAIRAFDQFKNDSFTEMLNSATHDGVTLSNHPAMLKVFADIGRKMGEGGLQTVVTESDKQAMESKIDELTIAANDALSRGDRMTSDRLFAERQELAERFYGTDSI